MFLPVSEVWSLDSGLQEWKELERATERGKPSKPSAFEYSHFSAASLGIYGHLFLCYIFSALSKTSVYPTARRTHDTGGEWFDGRAVMYALALDFFQKPVGGFILLLGKEVCTLLGIVTWYWEVVGPFLFVIPFYNG